MPDPRILFLDTENAPNLSYVWGKWEQDVIDVHTHWYFLCFGVKWLGDKRVKTHALPDYRAFRRDKEDDRQLCEELWGYLDDADIVIAHNGDRFDLRKANARFVAHGLQPPSPYKSIDTLKIARKNFQFDSNKLGDLGKYLGLGGKLPHTGAHLWFGCMNGDKEAWRLMREYNARDIDLLEEIYNRLKPWASNHPNLSHLSRVADSCPVCQSTKTMAKGWAYSNSGKRQRRKCNDCGHRFVSGPHIREPMHV